MRPLFSFALLALCVQFVSCGFLSGPWSAMMMGVRNVMRQSVSVPGLSNALCSINGRPCNFDEFLRENQVKGGRWKGPSGIVDKDLLTASSAELDDAFRKLHATGYTGNLDLHKLFPNVKVPGKPNAPFGDYLTALVDELKQARPALERAGLWNSFLETHMTLLHKLREARLIEHHKFLITELEAKLSTVKPGSRVITRTLPVPGLIGETREVIDFARTLSEYNKGDEHKRVRLLDIIKQVQATMLVEPSSKESRRHASALLKAGKAFETLKSWTRSCK